MTSTDPDTNLDRRRRNRLIVTLMFASAAIFFFGGGWLIRSKLADPLTRMNERRQRVLYGVDHAAVAEACRFVLDNRRSFRAYRNPESIGSEAGDDHSIDWSDPQVPTTIRDLVPSYVLVGQDHVRIEMGDDIYHFGLSYSPAPTKHSMKPLAENLYYYSQDGVVAERIR